MAESEMGESGDDETGGETSKGASQSESKDTTKGGSGNEEGHPRPEYIPEQFFDAKTGETDIEGLSKSYSEMGTKIREKSDTTRKGILKEMEADKAANRPNTANDYDVRVPDDMTETLGDGLVFEFSDSDPMLTFWKDFSYENGFNQETFDAGVSAYIKAKFSELPSFEDEIGKLGDNGRDRAQHVNLWAKKAFSEETYKALEDFAVTADGVMAIEEMMRNSGEPAFSPGGPAGIGGKISLNELREMQADPRYWDPNKREDSWIKKVDKGYEQLVS
jgi:hypothetical protein